MKIKDFTLGATGRRPFGQLDEMDEGELRMAIAADHLSGVVRLEFGKPVAWLGLPSTEARELGGVLIEKANELDAKKS